MDSGMVPRATSFLHHHSAEAGLVMFTVTSTQLSPVDKSRGPPCPLGNMWPTVVSQLLKFSHITVTTPLISLCWDSSSL